MATNAVSSSSTGDQGAPTKVSRSDFKSYMASPMVKIKVADRKEPYSVHKALLVEYVPYYRACLDSLFSESNTLEVTFDDPETSVIDGFLAWLVTGALEYVEDKIDEDAEYAVKLYQLADKRLIFGLKNSIVDLVRCSLSYYEDYEYILNCIIYLSENGLLDSQLARIVVDEFVWATNEHEGWQDFLKDQANTDEGVLNRLLENDDAIAKVSRRSFDYRVQKWDRQVGEKEDCSFHEHEDNEECCSESTVDVWD